MLAFYLRGLERQPQNLHEHKTTCHQDEYRPSNGKYEVVVPTHQISIGRSCSLSKPVGVTPTIRQCYGAEVWLRILSLIISDASLMMAPRPRRSFTEVTST